jgi:type I restriction enzyme S subunit
MNLPWPIKKLEEVCEPIKIEKAPVGIMPYIEIGDIDVETKKINFKEKGAVKGSIFGPDRCVIVSRVRPTRGAVALLDKKVAVSSAFTILKPKSILDLKFLFYYLAYNPNFFEYLGQRQKGSNYPSCREKDILNFEIPLPPLEIQKRIVARIEELFEKIDKAKQLREKILEETEQIFQTALQEIFDIAEKKWGVVKLIDISEKHPQYGYTESAKESMVGPKFLRITDIQNGKVDWDKVPYCQCSDRDFEKYKLEKDDILFARTGATTGKTYLVKECPPRAVFASYLIRLRCRKEKVLPEYVYVFFQSPQYWSQIIPNGGAQPNMNAQLLSRIQLPLPPLPEQKKIVAYLGDLREKVEKLKKIQQEQLKDLEELKKSILEKAFKGELIINLLK